MSWAIWPVLVAFAVFSMWLMLTATEEGADADELPPIVTLAPTATPTPVPLHALGYVSLPWPGGVDALFQSVDSAPAEDPLPPDAIPPPAPYWPGSTVEFAFQQGVADSGGLALRDAASWWRLALCESGGRIATEGAYYGLLQFSGSTWATAAAATGEWDYWSAYAQGRNGAWHALYGTVNPGGTGGWPVCWWR